MQQVGVEARAIGAAGGLRDADSAPIKTSTKLVLALSALTVSASLMLLDPRFVVAAVVALAVVVVFWRDLGREWRADPPGSGPLRVVALLIGVPQAFVGAVLVAAGLLLALGVLHAMFGVGRQVAVAGLFALWLPLLLIAGGGFLVTRVLRGALVASPSGGVPARTSGTHPSGTEPGLVVVAEALPAPVAAERLACPRCRSEEVIPIVYGVPTSLLGPLFMTGRIWPGGAMGRLLGGQAPQWRCSRCESEWRGGLYAGGEGQSLDQAVVIRHVEHSAVGIRVEKQYLTERFGRSAETAAPHPGWVLDEQALIEHADGRRFDRLRIVLPDGSARAVFFDVTAFFGKRP